MRTRALLVGVAANLLLFAGSSKATTLHVTSLADDGSSGTLRWAVNFALEGDTISIDKEGTIKLQPSGCPDTPSCGADIDADGMADLDIDHTVTIVGLGSDKTIIDGNGTKTNDRVFTVNNNNDGTGLLLQGVTVKNGNSASQGGGIYVSNNGWLTMRDSTVTANTATSDGGGIYLADEVGLVLDNSIVSHNKSNSTDGGGGLYAYSYDTVSITNSTFSKNHADNGYGGGVYTYESSSEILNSTFSDNTSDYGGGIYDYYGAMTVRNSTIDKNSSTYDGGGFADYESSGLIVDSTISNNSVKTDAYQGGGIYDYESNMTVMNSTIDSNTSDGAGGGIYSYEAGLNVINSTVSNNVANADKDSGDSTGGGGIYMYDDYSDTVANSVISDNTANADTASPGGGVMDYDSYGAVYDNVSFLNNKSKGGTGGTNSDGGGGGLYTYNYGTNIRNSLFSGNSVTGNDGTDDRAGGGIYVDDYNVIMQNSTLTGNSADGNGGGMYAYSYSTLLSNVTISDNTADANKGGLTHGDGGGLYNDDYTVTLKNSILFGNTDTGGEAPDCFNDFTTDNNEIYLQGANIIGNKKGCELFGETAHIIKGDPLLQKLADNDGQKQGADLKAVGQTLALGAGSPAINAGLAGCTATDARGVARSDATCDLGAFEAPPAVPANTGCASKGASLPLLLGLTSVALLLKARRKRLRER